jgi:uncharacterized protein YcfL
MKTLLFILVFALVGCSHSEPPAKDLATELIEWIPAGSSLASVRQIMEQHQFVCSIVSYNDVNAMSNTNPNAFSWTQSFIHNSGISEPVTNITTLNCELVESKKIWRHAEWVMINNKTHLLLWETGSSK